MKKQSISIFSEDKINQNVIEGANDLSRDEELLKELKVQLVNKYGYLITMHDMAKLLHRSYEGLRRLTVEDERLAKKLKAAKKKIGRRVYFRTLDVARILMD